MHDALRTDRDDGNAGVLMHDAAAPGAHSMDRRLEPKRFQPPRIALLAGVALVAAAAIYVISTRSGATTLRVEPARLTTATVEHGEFRDYYPVDGKVEPAKTVYLDVQEGGRVDEIFVA